MNTNTEPVVLLTHGVGVTSASWKVVSKFLERAHWQVDTFDWTTEMAHRNGATYGVRHLRQAYGTRLAQYARQGQKVIAINHSGGCFIGGWWHNHPAVLGSVHLALPPFGPYLKLGRNTAKSPGPQVSARRSAELAWQSLRGDWVTFSEQELEAYGTDPEHINGPIRVSGAVLRAFTLPGLYLPPNLRRTHVRVHTSAADPVVAPLWRTQPFLKMWGMEPVLGHDDFAHCDYTYRSNKMIAFWKHVTQYVLPRMVHRPCEDHQPIALPAE